MTSHTKIKLELNSSNMIEVLEAHQGDKNSRFIDVMLTSDGEILKIGEGISAKYDATIDNIVVADNLTATVNTAENIITVELTENMLSMSGLLKIDLKILESDALITAQTLRVKVGKSVINNDSKFEPTGGTVKQFMDEVTAARGDYDNLNTRFDSKADKAATLAGYGITDGENIGNKVSAVDFQHLNATDYPNITALYNYHTNYVEPYYDDIDNLENSKADKATTLDGYGITDAYTKDEVAGNVKAAINNAALSKSSMRRNYKRNLEVMELPADFNNNDFALNIYSDGYNFYTDFDVTKYKNKGGTVYYCNTFARGTKDGLSELNATSFLSLSRSGKLKDGDTIILLDGVHQSCNCSSSEESLSIPNVNIIAKNKRKAIVGNIMNNNTITWVNEGNGVYSADLTGTYTTIHNVIQKINDDFSSLKKVENAEDCDIQGTFAYISNVLYVHLFYNETPIRDNCMICKNYKFPCYEINSESKAITQYLEGVTFIGGTGSTLYVKGTETYKHKVYAKDCDFLYAHDDNLAKDAVSIVGADAYFVGCKAMYSSKDGFNYHKNGNSTPNFVEIDCVGANNGNDGIALATNSYWNNGSTAHEGVKGIRINCVYYNNYGGNVADVSDGTVTLNLGCVAFDSTAVKTHTAACADFVAQQPGATMYLYGCKAFGSTSSAYATAGSTLYIKNCDFENGASGEGIIG